MIHASFYNRLDPIMSKRLFYSKEDLLSDIENIVKEAIEKYTEDNPQQSFFTTIPTIIIDDKKLTPSEFKMLCILISFLSIKGTAHTGNKYLSNRFGVSEVSVSNIINSLKDKGYIELEYGVGNKRIIKGTSVLKKTLSSLKENFISSHKENFKNNINNINKNNIIDKPLVEREKEFREKVSELCPDIDKITFFHFCNYWTEHNEGGKKMRFEMQKVFDIKRRMTTWVNNNKKFNSNKSNTGMVVEKGRPQYTQAEWSRVIEITCQTKEERKDMYNKYNFDKTTNLWIKK